MNDEISKNCATGGQSGQRAGDHAQLFHFSELSACGQLLIGIPDIGPRTAITILSGIPWRELAQAVRENDRQRLQAIPRVGKKSVERIILELKDKFPFAPEVPQERGRETGESLVKDAVQVLVNLGYRKAIAEKTVREAAESVPEASPIEEIIKESLRRLVP